MKALKTVARITLAIAFWCALWQVASVAVGREYFLPGIPATLSALWVLLQQPDFYTTVLLSLLRVILGLTLGIAAGIAFSILSHFFSAVRHLLSPAVSIIKSTPVASFIVLLWIAMSGDELTVFIAFLMVMPIIWQNLMDGFAAIDRDLEEVCLVFGLPFLKRFRLLIFPTLVKFLVPGIITSVGLAWKSAIAAEIIAYTKNSIGGGISDAKYFSDTPTVFAWTLIVIIMSISLEAITKSLLRRVRI